MTAYITLCMALPPGMLFVLFCGAIQWLVGKVDKRGGRLRWYAGDTLGNARTKRRRAG